MTDTDVLSDVPAPSQPVVVGVDGSTCSAVAFTAALSEARERGLDVVALHAWLVTDPGLPLGGPAALDAETEQRLTQALDAHVQELLAGASDVVVERRLGYGHPGRVLVAASGQAQLLVVGSRGLGALRSALLGSVSQHVLEHASCPVLVAHEARTVRPARVVVGVDGSPASRAALSWADAESRRTGLPLSVHHSVAAFGSVLDPAESPPGVDVTELRSWVAEVLGADRSADVELVLDTDDAEGALLALAGDDVLLVIGRSGNGGLLRLGSVARRLAAHADGPVVVVGPVEG